MAKTNQTVLSWTLAIAGALGAVACKSTDENDSYYETGPRMGSGNVSTVMGDGSGSGSGSGSGAAEASSSSSSSSRRSSYRGSSSSASAMAFPTGDPSTSALMVEKVASSEATVGAPYTYEVVVTNLTDLSLDNVVITESMKGFNVSSSTPPASGAGRWNLGTMGPNEARSISITGTPQGEGEFSTCTSVDYDTSLCMTVDVVRAAISLKCGHDPDFAPNATVSLCDPINYVYEVCNTGSGTATNVRVNVPFQTGMTAGGKGTYTKTFASLAPGECKKFKVAADVTKRGTYSHSATATADGNLTANCQNVTTNVRQASLAITKDAPKLRFLGQKVNYEITVSNTGDMVSSNTIVEDMLPADVKFVSASDGGRLSGNKVTWNIGDLAPGATKKVTCRTEPSRFGTFTNMAKVTGDCVPSDPDDTAVTEIKGIPAILLEVVDLEDPIEVGDEVTYLITVTNQGSADDTNVKIDAIAPPNTTFVSASGDTAHTASGNNISFAPLAVLAPKAKATWRVVVRGNSAADARFRIQMNSDNLSSEAVQETEATNFYE